MKKIKDEISRQARQLGTGLIGFAPVERWQGNTVVSPDFFPDAVWPMAKTVISLSIPSLLPIVETKISHLYRAQYDIMNRLLDEMAYRLALRLNKNGWPSIPICRDGYGQQKMLRKNPRAAFSHVWAAYYAGLGTIGWNQTLITPAYGPRHRLVSVLTSLTLEGDPLCPEDLCNRCRICELICPTHVFSRHKSDDHSKMDKIACAKQTFDKPYTHCGFCIKACPVGADRPKFGNTGTRRYFDAHEDLSLWNMGVGANLHIDDNGQ